jgi:hypothetical protein
MLSMKLKQRNFPLILTLVLLGMATATKADTAQDLRIKDLLTRIEDRIPEGYRDAGAIIDNGNEKSPESLQLQSLVQKNWPTVLENLHTLAPTDLDKAVLFVACQTMSSDSYLRFLNRAAELAQSNVISKQLLKWALFPADKHVRGVLDYNYDKPIVKDILRKVKALYVDDPNMIAFCNNVLSGQSKRDDEAYFNDNPADPRPIPAVEDAGQGTGQQ